jgi:hypothetical protein
MGRLGSRAGHPWPSLRERLSKLVGRGFLVGVGAHDPLSFASAALVLLAAASLGVVLPARGAARVDPAAVLKEQ